MQIIKKISIISGQNKLTQDSGACASCGRCLVAGGLHAHFGKEKQRSDYCKAPCWQTSLARSSYLGYVTKELGDAIIERTK